MKTFKNIAIIFFFIFVFWPVSFANGWTITSDFEQGIVGQKAQGPSGCQEAFSQTFYTNEQAKSGIKSAKINWIQGSDGWGQSGCLFDYSVLGLADPSSGDEFWARAYFYYPSSFSFGANPHLKLFRTANIRTASGGNIGWHDMYANPNRTLKYISEIDPAANGPYGVSAPYDIWHSMEMYLKLSATPGQGVMRTWIDGVLVKEDKTHKTMANSTDKAVATYLFTYWNTAVPQNQHNYIDDVVITTNQPANRDAQGNYMIGPIGWGSVLDTTPPSSPTGLAVQ